MDSGSVSQTGEMAEWSKAHAWKVCIRQRIEGSNPSLSAIHVQQFQVASEVLETLIKQN